jgi:hypothetical protein
MPKPAAGNKSRPRDFGTFESALSATGGDHAVLTARSSLAAASIAFMAADAA